MSSQSYRLNVSYRWPSVNLRMTGSIPQKTKQTFHVFFQAESDNILHWHHYALYTPRKGGKRVKQVWISA